MRAAVVMPVLKWAMPGGPSGLSQGKASLAGDATTIAREAGVPGMKEL